MAAPSYEISWLRPYFEEKNYYFSGMYGAAGEGERRKMRVLWMMGIGVLIGCFSPHLISCVNPSYPILIGEHKIVGVIIEVILI